jgi:aspartokinase/homoserine dehydrogenase 1
MNKRNDLVIHKFGGSSLTDSRCIQQLITQCLDPHSVIVVSAMGNSTALLQQALNHAAQGENNPAALDAIIKIPMDVANTLLDQVNAQTLQQTIEKDQQHILSILKTIAFTKHYDKNLQDVVLGFGEIWSAKLLTAALQQDGRQASYLDAATVLFTEDQRDNVTIDWEKSREQLQQFMQTHQNCDVIVATGFLASDHQGHRTTLGANSSDYSAVIFATLFHSKTLTIWTDVDGVMSADPAQVPAAFVLSHISYKEALELAYFGASVIHPLTLPIAMQHQITIHIKNTFQPKAAGTCISATSNGDQRAVKGLTSTCGIALLNIEGAGMIGVSGIAACAFSALHQQHISVVFISQASSEYSICLAVKKEDLDLAHHALEQAFAYDLHCGRIDKIRVDLDCAIVAIVGEGMIGRPGISSKLCGALAASRINIRAIAQGSSERNVSIVIKETDCSRALRAIHSAYHLSNKTLSIGLVGPGQIGATLLAQLAKEASRLAQQQGINIQLRGIMNSRQMLLADTKISLDDWQAAFKQSTQTADLDTFIKHIRSDDIPHAVLIDATANDHVALRYIDAINHGLHIITPNKRANSGEWSYYQDLHQASRQNQRHYLYETTVCAGLPVIRTITDILHTGDHIESIEGVFSGTLGFIFGQIAQGQRFSQAVIAAHEQGYTEPDPRDDLSGADVARKTICLAREIGLQVSMHDLKVDNLVPPELRDCDRDTFLKKLPQFDDSMAKTLEDKRANGAGVHYLGRIEATGKVCVGLSSYPENHLLAGLQATDNIVMIHTQRYHQQPLVIQGPGAGADVTAAGVFADLLRLISQL